MLWNAIQVATWLGTASRAVEKWAKQGIIPCIALPNGTFVFDPEDVLKWVLSRKQQPREAASA